MASYSTNEFRNGLKVMLEGEPCVVLEAEFVKPGKGQAFTRARFRNLISGRVWDRTLRSGGDHGIGGRCRIGYGIPLL